MRISFTKDQLNEQIERSKVIDQGWYPATIQSPVTAKTDKSGQPLYVAKVQLESGKVLFHNFSIKALGFWLPAIAAAKELDIEEYQRELDEKISASSDGDVDIEAELMSIAGCKVKIYVDLQTYNGQISNTITKWASIDAKVS